MTTGDDYSNDDIVTVVRVVTTLAERGDGYQTGRDDRDDVLYFLGMREGEKKEERVVAQPIACPDLGSGSDIVTIVTASLSAFSGALFDSQP